MPNSFILTSCTCVIRCDADFQRYLRFCHIKSCITKFKMIPVGYFELFHQCRITNVLVDNASMTVRCISRQAHDEWRSTIVSMLKDAILCNHVITVMPSWHPKLPETWLFIYQHLPAYNSKTVKVPQWLVFSPTENLGAVLIRKTVLPGMAIPMLKIRRPNGRLIFNMEIAIPR